MYSLKKLILVILFHVNIVDCINVYNYGTTGLLTCTLPAIKHADKVILLKGSKKNNTLRLETNITNAGLDTVCYCGDPNKNYSFIIDTVTSKHEGRFKCIFQLGKNETYRHTVHTIVLPSVNTYHYEQGKYICYICNISRPINGSKLNVYMVAGGANITNRFLREFNSTDTHLVVGICTDTSYEDWTREAVCGVSYYDHVTEYNISYTSSNKIYTYFNEYGGSGSGLLPDK
ncbi:SWPV1-296 [Shearwaterpox virus]|uniref:SWPV1-296 n=1 Tax=Shearwaterpox virus TaxID=1974596 RepID=A0A1V0S8A6_CNPV|nr:SWPV1-296 [Shearwaterpox virus]